MMMYTLGYGRKQSHTLLKTLALANPRSLTEEEGWVDYVTFYF